MAKGKKQSGEKSLLDDFDDDNGIPITVDLTEDSSIDSSNNNNEGYYNDTVDAKSNKKKEDEDDYNTEEDSEEDTGDSEGYNNYPSEEKPVYPDEDRDSVSEESDNNDSVNNKKSESGGRAQQRINELYRKAKEAEEREARVIEQHKKDVETLVKRFEELQEKANKDAEQSYKEKEVFLSRQLENLEAQIDKLSEEGDTKNAYRLQREYQDKSFDLRLIRAKLNSGNSFFDSGEALNDVKSVKDKLNTITSQKAVTPAAPELAVKWVQQYGQKLNTDQGFRDRAMAYSKILDSEGMDSSKQEYYDELEYRLGMKQRPNTSGNTRPNRGSPPVAGSVRSSGMKPSSAGNPRQGSKYPPLTDGEKRVAREFGMTEEEYQRAKKSIDENVDKKGSVVVKRNK